MQVSFSSYDQTVDLWVRSKGQISFNIRFQRYFYQTLCVFPQKKIEKHIEQNFHSVARFMPPGETGGESKL